MSQIERLKNILIEKSYEQRDVVLASGEKSNFYFDGKQTSLTAEGAHLLGKSTNALANQDCTEPLYQSCYQRVL